ncbi:MAG: 6-phosphogluconolactonase [bacterium]
MKPFVFINSAAATQFVADQLVASARTAIAVHGQFTLALAGGSTPRALYELLASSAYASQIDWAHTHIFWGDERCVPPDSDESNYKMAKTALLDHIPIPPANIHRIKGELPPERAAAEYAAELLPLDMILLGLGTDGHTASLFPASPALHAHEMVVAVYQPTLPIPHRITLTPMAINQAKQKIFLVTGAEKAHILHEVIDGPHQPEKYPAQLISSAIWVVDTAEWA